MPSLHTVNHLLSNYFTHVLPLLPIVQSVLSLHQLYLADLPPLAVCQPSILPTPLLSSLLL